MCCQPTQAASIYGRMVRYRINSPHVVCQIFDTETVAVNMESGCYYSVEGSGSGILRCVESGCTHGEILAAVAPGDDAAAASVEAFLREALAEGLIVGEECATVPGVEASPADASPAKPWVLPRLQKFTDMRELLLLDPIHELDQAGWPQSKQP